MLLKKLISNLFSVKEPEKTKTDEPVKDSKPFGYIHHSQFNYYGLEVTFPTVGVYIEKLSRINSCFREDIVFHSGYVDSPKKIVKVGEFFLTTDGEYLDSDFCKKKLCSELLALINEHEREVNHETMTDARKRNLVSSRRLASEAVVLLGRLSEIESMIMEALNE